MGQLREQPVMMDIYVPQTSGRQQDQSAGPNQRERERRTPVSLRRMSILYKPIPSQRTS